MDGSFIVPRGEAAASSRFARALNRVEKPPARLYHSGADHWQYLLSNDVVRIGVVGSRSCSSEGAVIARTWAEHFAGEGAVVVSGLARGIDGEAHRGALVHRIADAALSPTIAIMGCGIDVCYPRAHRDLWLRIHNEALVLSEYEGDTPPAPWQFPARNRVVAALSDVLVIVEARVQSGSLITVDAALEIGTPVCVLPNPIDVPMFEGSNDLLTGQHVRDGRVIPVTDPDQVLDVARQRLARLVGARS